MSQLDLGWSQHYMGLQYHMEDALKEKGLNIRIASNRPPFAIFSHDYYTQIDKLSNNKIYDFCFIGSINSDKERRKWVIDFAKNNFTEKSIFINTDNDINWNSLGEFDLSNRGLGFCPKNTEDNQSRKIQFRIVNENVFYFESMKKSKFVLCPAGDSTWSFRFYEVLMCKSIPIVESWHHTYRTKEESELPYMYVLSKNSKDISDILNNTTQYNTFIDRNTSIFFKHHML